MQILRIILTLIFVIDCIALTAVVLMQEVSQALRILTGEEIRDVLWKAAW